MANRKGKGRPARTSSVGADSPPDTKQARSKPAKSASSKRLRGKSRRSKRPTSIPPNWFTRKDLPPRGGELSLKFPADYVVCMRGLAKLHGRSLTDTFLATLWSYLKLTRADQRKALDLEPAMPVQEVRAWGGVYADGKMCPWAAPSFEKALGVVNDPNEVVRVVVRHLPAEPGIKPRGWKE